MLTWIRDELPPPCVRNALLRAVLYTIALPASAFGVTAAVFSFIGPDPSRGGPLPHVGDILVGGIVVVIAIAVALAASAFDIIRTNRRAHARLTPTPAPTTPTTILCPRCETLADDGAPCPTCGHTATTRQRLKRWHAWIGEP